MKFTGSPVAKAILDDWDNELRYFVKVMPNDYRRVLEHQAEMEARAAALSKRQSAAVLNGKCTAETPAVARCA